MLKADEAKKTIIEAATELLMRSSGDINEITTRMIAEKAGVGVGLINYHFQTKDSLIEICVQRIIHQVTGNFRPLLEPDLKGNERLKIVVKLVADFLMNNQAISRISILGDYSRPASHDNTMNTVDGFSKALVKEGKEIGGGQKSSLFALTSVLQAAFLRKDLTAELFGYDFNDKAERDLFIDLMVETLFAGGGADK